MGWKGWESLINFEAFLATLGWYGLSLVLYATLPAQEVEGIKLRNGARLKYRFNGELQTYMFNKKCVVLILIQII